MSTEITRRCAAAYARGVFDQLVALSPPMDKDPHSEMLAMIAMRAKKAGESEYSIQIKAECNEYGSWSFS